MRNESNSKPTTNGTSRDAISPDVGLPNISSVKLVPLASIDVRPQVRTIFDDGSIADLAADIQTRGLLQPVLLNPRGARFDLIAGERRVRACVLAGLSDIPALITKASSGDVMLMQLAENIQREDLDLQDQVRAIRQLHDHLGTVAAVADTVKKSSAWVSKRLALSHPDFGYKARNLMENGVTEDVEILNTLSHIEAINYWKANELEKHLLAGTATRETARQMLKDLKNPPKAKDGADPTAKQQKQDMRWQDQQKLEAVAKQLREEGNGPEFITWAWQTLERACCFPDLKGFKSTAFFDKLHRDQREALRRHVQTVEDEARGRDLKQWAYFTNTENEDYSYLEVMVGIYTLKGHVIDNLAAFLTILEDANRPEPTT